VSMDRRPLRRLLQRYERCWPEERDLAARFMKFVDDHPDCLLRTCAPGHVTASAWILDASGSRALLTHHKKLGKWLQLGGHVDGDPDVAAACLREAQEESGMQDFSFVSWSTTPQPPIDLDVHEIPARREEPAHLHWDLRFLLQAAPGQTLTVSDESNELAWAPLTALGAYTQEESVLRMHRKAQEVRSCP